MIPPDVVVRWWVCKTIDRQTSNIEYTLVGYKIVDHSDVVGASPPTTSALSI